MQNDERTELRHMGALHQGREEVAFGCDDPHGGEDTELRVEFVGVPEILSLEGVCMDG